jgi:hypothetical protein
MEIIYNALNAIRDYLWFIIGLPVAFAIITHLALKKTVSDLEDKKKDLEDKKRD